MAEVMEILEKKYDFVLIDVPSVNSSVDANIFAVKSDATIMVTAMGKAILIVLETDLGL